MLPTNLETVMSLAVGAYSENTMRGYRVDLQIFEAWCKERGREWFPASSETVAAFVDKEIARVTIATLKRRLAAITFAHRISDLPSPVDSSAVQLALRRAARRKPRRPEQVQGLTAEILDQILTACPATLIGFRDAALIAVGYDTLCRSSELAAMRVEHLNLNSPDAHVFIPRSKSDIAGDGRMAFFSNRTRKAVQNWLKSSNLETGKLFRGLSRGVISKASLDTSTIRRLIKRAAHRADIPREIATKLSGHSMRIGAAQDMMATGFDSLAIMQSGGWKTPHVVLRYVENASTRRLHERRWERLRISR